MPDTRWEKMPEAFTFYTLLNEVRSKVCILKDPECKEVEASIVAYMSGMECVLKLWCEERNVVWSKDMLEKVRAILMEDQNFAEHVDKVARRILRDNIGSLYVA